MFARPTASAIALFALLAFWTPFFYLTLVVPGLSLEATPPVVQHRIAGLVIELRSSSPSSPCCSLSADTAWLAAQSPDHSIACEPYRVNTGKPDISACRGRFTDAFPRKGSMADHPRL